MAAPSIDPRALAEFERLEATRLRNAVRAMTLETLFTHPAAFGIATATPVQRAICRLIEGRPLGDLATHPDVLATVGDVSGIAGSRPSEVYLLAGIRSAKTTLAAALGYRGSQTCDLSRLGPGEIPRFSIVAPVKDLADVCFKLLKETVLARLALAGALLEEPTADTLLLRHPSGKPVEVKVVAGSKAGTTLVARWSAGCVFDEFPRMNGEEDGVVNFDDARRAVIGRMLPGAQLFGIGSPWAPRGPAYEAVQEHWRKPKPTIVVIRAPGPVMNPYWWTPERVAEMKARDSQTYRTDVLGEFAQPETALFETAEIERATREGQPVVEREPGHSYVAAIDPATRENAWTLIICGRRRRPSDGKQRTSVVLARQWLPKDSGGRLEPDKVLREVAAEVHRYGLTCAWSDQWAADALKDIANRHGLSLYDENITAARKVEMFESLRMRLADDAIELPDDATLRGDLLGVRKRVTTTGVAIDLPRTADGRHADYASALALAASKPLMDAPLPVRTPTIEEKIAGLRKADEARWKEVERRGDERAVSTQARSWIEELEEMAYGPE